jgi:hypothetical protein
MVENIALALASAATDGDDADETLNELESGDGLRIHLELSSLAEPVMMEPRKVDALMPYNSSRIFLSLISS